MGLRLDRKNRTWQIFLIVAIILIIIIILTIPSAAPHCHHSGPRQWTADGSRNFAIRTTWDAQCIDNEPVILSLAPNANGDVTVKIQAPFFNSPRKPDGPPGKPFPQLWDYEVVETFFLNDKDQYLEVEFCPHGQFLALLLKGRRKIVTDKSYQLQLDFTASISSDKWAGEATIPRAYFPPGVTKFNAFAIHGEGTEKQYESLYPFPNPGADAQPDFHRLELFQPIDMTSIMNDYDPKEVSDIWKQIV